MDLKMYVGVGMLLYGIFVMVQGPAKYRRIAVIVAVIGAAIAIGYA